MEKIHAPDMNKAEHPDAPEHPKKAEGTEKDPRENGGRATAQTRKTIEQESNFRGGFSDGSDRDEDKPAEPKQSVVKQTLSSMKLFLSTALDWEAVSRGYLTRRGLLVGACQRAHDIGSAVLDLCNRFKGCMTGDVSEMSPPKDSVESSFDAHVYDVVYSLKHPEKIIDMGDIHPREEVDPDGVDESDEAFQVGFSTEDDADPSEDNR